MPDQICTVAQVKARLFPAGVTDTTDDTLITELIQQVSSWIEHYTEREFAAETGVTYLFDTQAGYVLRIPKGIRTITSMGVAFTHQPDTGGTYTTVAAADRILRPLRNDTPDDWPYTEVRISRAATGTVRHFYEAQNGCTITGNFGFANPPPDLQGVCIDAVVAAFQSRKDGASAVMGVEDIAMPPWARYFGRGSPQRATLDRYRYVGFG